MPESDRAAASQSPPPHLRLIEMGWDVLRFWVYEVRDTLPTCVARVAAWVEEADALPEVA